VETLWQDTKYGFRMLAKSPGFTAIAVLTLGLGIGANTAIFSVVNSVLLRPLPYREPERIVRVFSVWTTQPHFPMAIADFKDYQQQNQVFSSAALYAERDLDLTTNGRPEHLVGMGVTHEFFQVLGYQPALGRDFQPSEEYDKSNRVAILSDHLWRNRFASDPHIVGKSVTFSGEPYTVVGVMPTGVLHPGGEFNSPKHGEEIDIWHPLAIYPPTGCDRGCHFLNMIARLKPGVTVEQAGANLNAIAAALIKANLIAKDGRILVLPLKEEVVGQARLMLLVLFGAVAFLLLIACVNVANLSLARATSRVREISLRSVLGAGRLRIVRQLLTESFLVAALGLILGTILAKWGVDALIAISPAKFPRLHAVQVDARVLVFAATVAFLTALIFGLAPALAIVRGNVNALLRDGDRGTTAGSGRVALRNWLAATEIALALVLLAGAGLLMRTFVNLRNVSMGFQPEHVLTFETNLPYNRYHGEAFPRFYQSLAARVESLPGVELVAESSDLPWTGADENTSFEIEGRPSDRDHEPEARYHFASPDYFRAVGVPLLHGRFFDLTDDPKAQKAILVNAAFERRYFPDEGAIGKRIDLWGAKGVTIVGVIGDVKDAPDSLSVKPALYWDDWQSALESSRVVVVRSTGDPMILARAIPGEVQALDKDLPVTELKPMAEVGTHALATPRFTVLLVGTFAVLALILAAVGIFGVMAYSVTQRTHEIGVRVALGAQRRDVLGLVVSQGARVAAAGVVAGIVFALLLTRAMTGLLYGVRSADPWTFLAVAAVLVAVALAACYFPALRAARVDPLVALRHG